MASLWYRLKHAGAKRIILCASHGLMRPESMHVINLWPIEEMVITDSIPLPSPHSSKVTVLPLAPLITKILKSEINELEAIHHHDFAVPNAKVESLKEEPVENEKEEYEVE